MLAFIGAWTSESQKRHAAAAAAAAHASPATAAAAAVSPPILPLSMYPSPPSPPLHHQPPPSSLLPAPLPAPLPPPPPSHDRLAILQGARTDTPPFPDLRLDDDPRLASGCFVARHLLSYVYSIKFGALSQQVIHIPAEVGLDWLDDARHVIDRILNTRFTVLLSEVSPKACDVSSIIHRALGGGSRRDEGRARLAHCARHVIHHIIHPRVLS